MLARSLIAAIRFYQKGISPLKPPVCRFTPTCSHYGAARGSWLLVRRLARCHPFCRGGWDPVP